MKGIMTQMENVGERKFQLLPEGVYTIEIVEKADKQSKNGDPMVALTMTVSSGEYKDQAKLFDYITIASSPASKAWNIRWRVKMFLKAIGEPHKGDSFDWDSDRWLWKKCQVKIKHEEQAEGKYKGQIKAVVDSYAPLTGDIANDPDIPF